MERTDVITVGWCRERDACYSDDRLREVLGDGVPTIGVLDLDIPLADRIWAVSQALDDSEAREFLIDTLARCFSRERQAGRVPDPRSVAVLTALQQGRCPTDDERAAAWAAEEAAWAAAETAAAWAAAAAAAAARAAAWAAAAAAAARAAEAAERQAQADSLKRILARRAT